jgi:hypothetical protein
MIDAEDFGSRARRVDAGSVRRASCRSGSHHADRTRRAHERLILARGPFAFVLSCVLSWRLSALTALRFRHPTARGLGGLLDSKMTALVTAPIKDRSLT